MTLFHRLNQIACVGLALAVLGLLGFLAGDHPQIAGAASIAVFLLVTLILNWIVMTHEAETKTLLSTWRGQERAMEEMIADLGYEKTRLENEIAALKRELAVTPNERIARAVQEAKDAAFQAMVERRARLPIPPYDNGVLLEG